MIDSDVMRRAERAKRELRETEIAFNEVRSVLVTKLLSSGLDESDKRERLYLAVQVLDAVRSAMRDVMAGGEIEAKAAELAESFNVQRSFNA